VRSINMALLFLNVFNCIIYLNIPLNKGCDYLKIFTDKLAMDITWRVTAERIGTFLPEGSHFRDPNATSHLREIT